MSSVHLQGAHGKLGAWVYRTRRSWWLLAGSRASSSLGATWADAALGLFFGHFFPRFNARAFVLSRQQEYEADAVAHKVAGATAAAEGLLAMSVQARFLGEHFWRDVYATAKASATPRVQPYRLMRKRLREALAHRHLRQAQPLVRPTTIRASGRPNAGTAHGSKPGRTQFICVTNLVFKYPSNVSIPPSLP